MKRNEGLIFLFIFIFIFSASSLSFQVDASKIKGQHNEFSYYIEKDEVTIYDITHAENAYIPSVVIPDNIENYPVRIISLTGISDAMTIQELTISGNVSYIYLGEYIEVETMKVSEDNLDYTLKDGILYNKDMSRLSRYPSSNTNQFFKVPDNVEHINSHAFTHSKYLNHIELPEKQCGLGIEAFYGCEDLNLITIPAGWTEIPAEAFKGSSMKTIEIPNTVTEIGGGAFRFCQNLSEINLPEGITRISLIREGYEVVEYFGAFERCTSLKKVTIPNSMTEIPANTFRGCTNLEELTLGNNIQKIHETAFKNCNNIKIINGKEMTIEEYIAINNIEVMDDPTVIFPPEEKLYPEWMMYLIIFGVFAVPIAVIVFVVYVITRIVKRRRNIK